MSIESIQATAHSLAVQIQNQLNSAWQTSQKNAQQLATDLTLVYQTIQANAVQCFNTVTDPKWWSSIFASAQQSLQELQQRLFGAPKPSSLPTLQTDTSNTGQGTSVNGSSAPVSTIVDRSAFSVSIGSQTDLTIRPDAEKNAKILSQVKESLSVILQGLQDPATRALTLQGLVSSLLQGFQGKDCTKNTDSKVATV